MHNEIIFVYGTLKRGYGNYERLLKGSKFLGRAYSAARYRMYNIGFPCLLDCGMAGDPVAGELFEVTPEVLSFCDRLEGHPQMYCRKLRHFVLEGKVQQAWVYIYQHPQRFQHDEDIRILPNEDGHLEWHGRRLEDDLRDTIIEQIRGQQREQGVHVMRPSEAAKLTMKQLEAKYDRLEERYSQGQTQAMGGLYP